MHVRTYTCRRRRSRRRENESRLSINYFVQRATRDVIYQLGRQTFILPSSLLYARKTTSGYFISTCKTRVSKVTTFTHATHCDARIRLRNISRLRQKVFSPVQTRGSDARRKRAPDRDAFAFEPGQESRYRVAVKAETGAERSKGSIEREVPPFVCEKRSLPPRSSRLRYRAKAPRRDSPHYFSDEARAFRERENGGWRDSGMGEITYGQVRVSLPPSSSRTPASSLERASWFLLSPLSVAP